MSQTQQLDLNKAVTLLVQGILIAQKRGAYELNESAILSQAVNFFVERSQNIQQQQNMNQTIPPAQPIPLMPIEEEEEEDETLII
jgi:hypothetical protein